MTTLKATPPSATASSPRPLWQMVVDQARIRADHATCTWDDYERYKAAINGENLSPDERDRALNALVEALNL